MCSALVDKDEPLIVFHISDVAEAAGARRIACAQTAVEAISAAMERKPDIIVSDVKLAMGTSQMQGRASELK